MKKFGTPILAAPGSASEYVGSLSAGGWACSAAGGRGGRRPLRPCPSATRCWRRRRALLAGSSALSSVFVGVLPLSGSLPLSSVLPEPPFLPPLSGVAVGEAVAVSVGVGHDRRRGGRRRCRRRLGRAEVDDRGDGRGQARDLDLIDRRAGRDLDRDRELLARDQRHAHVMHLRVRGRHEHTRVEGGGGERDGDRSTRGHEPAGGQAAGAALCMGGHSEAWTPRISLAS